MTGPWLSGATSKPDARLRLLLLPYAGGGASLFHGWASSFDADIDVLAVHLPGREDRLREPPFTRLAQLADTLAEALMPIVDRPTVLFGWSMGARIAHAVAQRLELAGVPPCLLIAAAHPAPQHAHHRLPIHALAGERFWQAIAELGGTPKAILADRDLRDLIEGALRADFQLIETCPTVAPRSIACPVVAIAADADGLVDRRQVEDWTRTTSGRATVRTVAGGHFALRDNPEVVKVAVRAAITWALDRFTDTAAPEGRGLTLRDFDRMMTD
ncbi:MAG: Thioesterase [Proteobacteria bacterium]|nr:Thioesterase [Pseudomonadota bacterium]